jgi:uncharacterized membrane protein YjdF
MKARKVSFSKTLSNVIFALFALSAIYSVVRIIFAPDIASGADLGLHTKSDYSVILAQCIFGIVAMLLPGFLQRRFRVSIPSGMILVYALFLFCAIYLGEIQFFYNRVPHWDTVLHSFSGVALGALGFALVELLNNSKSAKVRLSPIFVALFAFSFALSLDAVWEICEFTMDSIFHTNAQRYMMVGGNPLVGQAALLDTMKDLIVDALGALVISIVGYVSIKREKGWFRWLGVQSNGEKNSGK